jgi:hypothetical protein
MNVEMENKTAVENTDQVRNGEINPNMLIDRFIEINENLTELYEKKKSLLKIGINEFGTDPLIKQNEDGTWTRITFVDNAERMNNGYYELVKIELFSVKIDTLKNKPKELK